MANNITQTKSYYIDMNFLLKSLLEKKLLITVMSFLIFCCAMIYTTHKPVIYRATALLEVDQKEQNSLGNLPSSNQHTSLNTMSDESISAQIALMNSNFILSPVINALGLDIRVSPEKKFFSASKNKTNEIHIAELTVPHHYLKKPLKLVVDSPNHYRLYNTKNKLLLVGNVGELIKSKNALSIKITKLPADKNHSFIIVKIPEPEVITQLRSHLMITDLSGASELSNKPGLLQISFTGNDPEKTMQIVNAISTITQQKDIERKTAEAKKTLDFLQQELPVIQASLNEAEAKLNQYLSTSGKINTKTQSEYLLSHLAEIDKELEGIKLKEIEMSALYTAQHPFIINLNEKRRELEQQRTETFEQIQKLPATNQVAANLSRDVDVKNNLYVLMLNKIHEQQVIAAGIVSDIRILTSAKFPDSLFHANLILVSIASLLIGFILTCFAVISWSMLRI